MSFYSELREKVKAMLLDSSDSDFIEYNGVKIQKTDKEKLLKLYEELSKKIAFEENDFKRVITVRM